MTNSQQKNFQDSILKMLDEMQKKRRSENMKAVCKRRKAKQKCKK